MTLTTTKSLDFGRLNILYDNRVLAPRGWTAMQSAWAADLLHELPTGPVLELCAGVGHIGLLAVALHPRDLVQVDLSGTACEYARINAAAAALPVAIEVRHGHMGDVLDPGERFALIIADPPWLPTSRTPDFPGDPLFAVDGGADGLDVARTCIGVISAHLEERGAALLQLGSVEQVRALQQRLEVSGLRVDDTRAHEDRGVVVRLGRT